MDQQRRDLVRFSIFSLLLLFLAFAPPAGSSVITDPSQLAPGFTLIDFEAFQTNGNLLTGVPNPLIIGEATFTSLTGNLSIFDLIAAGRSYGNVASSKTLFPGGEPDSAISITFAKPVSQFLVGWAEPDFSGNFLRAYDSAGNLLEQTNVLVGLVPGAGAAWIGFKRPVADIAKIIVQPDQSSPSGDDYALDNVYFTEAQPFSKMSARLQADFQPDGLSGVQLTISVALGKASNGINPVSEDIIFTIGDLFVRLPAGSLTRNKQGTYVFQGTVGSANFNITLKPAKGGYEFQASSSELPDLNGSTLPLNAGLVVGDDAGSVVLTNVSAQSE